MGAGMANFGLELTSDIGVSDLLLDETSGHFLDCLYKGQFSVVFIMVIQTIQMHV